MKVTLELNLDNEKHRGILQQLLTGYTEEKKAQIPLPLFTDKDKQYVNLNGDPLPWEDNDFFTPVLTKKAKRALKKANKKAGIVAASIPDEKRTWYNDPVTPQQAKELKAQLLYTDEVIATMTKGEARAILGKYFVNHTKK